MFSTIVKYINSVLYVLKFSFYSIIAFYLYFQIKAADYPKNIKVEEFLDWSDSVLLHFLCAVAAVEAIHIAIKPFLSWAKYLDERNIENIERQFRNYK